jgi:hypothetical protein
MPLTGFIKEVIMMKSNLSGKRIELVLTTDKFTTLKPGEKGTVDFVDDLGTIHVTWDNGSNLGLVPGEDQYKLLEDE